MKKLRTLLKIFLMVAGVSLFSGCDDDFPSITPKLVNYSKNRYLTHVLVDKTNITFRKDKWVTGLESLDAHYCFSPEDIGAVMEAARRKKAKAEPSLLSISPAEWAGILFQTETNVMTPMPTTHEAVQEYLSTP